MFRKRQAAGITEQHDALAPATVMAGEEQSCPGLTRALEHMLRARGKPEVLDLGPLCGPTVIQLADRGCRVAVGEYAPPPEPAEDDGAPRAALEIAQPSGKFDLVLVWERLDFTPPDRLAEFGAELNRILAPGGYVVLLCRDRNERDAPELERPSRFRLLADGRLLREPDHGTVARRWAHPNRRIEQALSPLAIQAVQLGRNRLREFLLAKKAPAARPDPA